MSGERDLGQVEWRVVLSLLPVSRIVWVRPSRDNEVCGRVCGDRGAGMVKNPQSKTGDDVVHPTPRDYRRYIQHRRRGIGRSCWNGILGMREGWSGRDSGASMGVPRVWGTRHSRARLPRPMRGSWRERG